VWTQQFDENTDINLTGIIYGEATWINTDNNVKKELLIAGYDTNYDNFSGIYSYQDNNSGLLSNSIEAYAHANIEQLDYNNDGYMDIIINGYNANDNEEVRLLLNNNDGSFSEQILPIDATSTGNMAIADLNNDNLSDIIITGVSPNDSDYIAKVYIQDNEGVFNERASSLFGNSFGDILVFDANNDGNNDVLITGFNNSYNPDTKLYLNDGNATFTENENANIMGIYFSATNAIDYDNDGDLDLVVSGFDTSYTPFSALYDNDGNGNFSLNSQPNLMALYWGAADFVDYDNDGDYDIFLTGADSNTTPHALFYKNTNGNFTKDETTSNLVSGTYISSTDWSDFDNDGDLDLVITGLGSSGDAISKVYNNTQNQLNTTTFNTIDSLTLYPNPVTNGKVQFSFSLSQNTEPFLITIFSTDGKRVLSTKQNLNKSIDVSQLQKGIYMLQLSNIKQTVSKKLIIN
jgi:hypothetical protein